MSKVMITASLEILIDFKNGKIAPKVSGTIPVYGGNGILGYTNQSNYEKVVIIGRVGAYCGSVHIENGKCWVSDNAIAGVPKDVENNDYNYYLLKSISLNKKQIGSSQPLLTQGILNSIDLKIHHDRSIRKSIGTLLSALDSKIELNNRINAELESMAKTLYDYWFVQFDFPDKNGKAYKTSGGKMVWNDDLKIEVPEGWEVKDLADVATTIMRGISPSYREEGGICVLNQKCIRDQSISFAPSRRHDNELKDANSRLIEYGDVLVNSTGFGTLGRVAIVKRLKEPITVVDSHITIVRSESENIKKLFLGYSMLIRQSEIEGLAEGSTGQTELSRVNLGKLKMVIPPIELQSVFENFINPQFQKMANNEAENEQLTELRDWLLPMLMNGQVTVGETTNIEVKKVERNIYNINMQKLLHVASELHKTGYEKLRVVPSLSPSGMSWRCSFVAEPENGIITSTWLSEYFHNEREIEYSIIELTEIFEREHMRFLESCKGKNKDYVEWYQNMLSHLDEGELPYAFAEYFSPTDYWKTTNDQKIETLPNEKNFYYGY